MPPRFAYWTIILEGKPTAFRATHRDELLPTFKQLQNKHPDIVLKWFARGRLWGSPEEAQAAQRAGVARRRTADWRPGGEHRDPRGRFKIPRDEKRRRFAARLQRDPRDRRKLPESPRDKLLEEKRESNPSGKRPQVRRERPAPDRQREKASGAPRGGKRGGGRGGHQR